MSSRPGLPFDLFLRRIDALYRHDADGRLLGSNEWDTRPAPCMHLLRTPQGAILRCRADLPDAQVRLLRELADSEPAERAFEPLPARHDDYLDVLSDTAPVRVWAGPVYLCADDATLPQVETVDVDEGNIDLLRGRFDDWQPDVAKRRPFVARIMDGRAAAICASVRISAAVHCAGVETHADVRGRGYGRDAVAGWARAVRACGVVPFYSTSWSNAASIRLAERLGFVLVGTDFYLG
jgi:RimJ/RimL family protein N-acetyltransferase